MLRIRVSIVVTILAAVAATAPALRAADEAAGVKAILELSQPVYYEGDPLPVRLSIGSEAPETVANPVKSPLFAGFRVRRANGEALRATGTAGADEPARPDRLAHHAFYGAVVDLVRLFPELGKRGAYEISWESNGVASNQLVVRIIPKYDPAKSYRARVETEEGTIVLEFFPKTAPIAVKSFIDMANAGFYDGLLIHEVRPDTWIAMGNPAASGDPRQPLLYPAEQSSVPVVAGTVVLRPVGVSPPANGSEFLIMLRPQPEFTGQVTVVGQVVSGLDVAQRLSRRPSTQEASRPFYKPLRDIKIQRIVIEPVSTSAGS